MTTRTTKGAKTTASPPEGDEDIEALWAKLRALSNEIDRCDERIAKIRTTRDPLDAERRAVVYQLHKQRGQPLRLISEITGLSVQAMSQQAMKGRDQVTG